MPARDARRDETSDFIRRRYRRTRLVLLAAAACLMLALYALAFDPIPGWRPAGGALSASPTLAGRLGNWMGSLHLGSGSPSERPYYLLVFWFVAFCISVYLRYFGFLRRLALALDHELAVTPLREDERVALFLPWFHSRFLVLLFPAVTAAVTIASPWPGDAVTQKMFYLVMGAPLLVMTAGLAQNALWKHPAKLRPPYVEFTLVLLLFVAPLSGSTLAVFLVVTVFLVQILRTFLPAWAGFSMKVPM